jgi:hypothetical protein
MPTTNKGLEQPALNSTNWNIPNNANFGVIDEAFGGRESINVTGVGVSPVTLTTSQYQKLALIFFGTLTNNVIYRIPSGIGGQWQVANGTTGAFTLTIDSAGGGASVTIPTGARRIIFSDGTNIYLSDNAVASVGASGNLAYASPSGLTGSDQLNYSASVLRVGIDDATANGASASLRVAHTTSGTAAAGIASGISFSTEVPSGSEVVGAGIFGALATATAGAEDYEIQFRLMAAGAAAATVAKITNTAITFKDDVVLTGRIATNTAVQDIGYAGIVASADADGTFTTGTYTPTPVGGNFKTITNGGAFTLAAPTASGDYTMVIRIVNNASAGAITLTGFTRVTGDTFTTTNGNAFLVSIIKVSTSISANVQAMQ